MNFIDDNRMAVLHYLEGLSPESSSLVFGERIFEDSDIWVLEPHRHSFIELIYITDGSLRIDVPGRQINRPTGSLIVYPSGVLHREYLHRQERERIICIGIEMPGTRVLNTSFETDDPDGRLRQLMETMLLEYTNRGIGWDIVAKSSVISLFILLKRGFMNPTCQRSDSIARCISYIQTHLAEDMSIELLSRIAYVSPSHLTRCIRERTGYTPIAYIKACRLELAKRKLTTLQDSVGNIAVDCGFKDSKYFSRIFKQETGITPHKYRVMYMQYNLENKETLNNE